MAGLLKKKRKSGDVAYQICWYDGKARKCLSLGSRYPEDVVLEIKRVVEKVIAAQAIGTPLDKQTTAWIENASDDMKQRFENAGLIEIERTITLENVWDEYWEAEYWDLKPSSQSNKRQSRRKFFLFFDPSTPVESIGRKDALAYVRWLDERGSEATRAGAIRDARRAFNWAIENELIDKNPFAGIPRGSFQNKERETFVDRATYQALLDAAPDAMYRTLLALYRIGGLRKDEALLLEWRDIDWERGRVLVHSPKTERYKGKETRVVPLFPELRRELEVQWNQTPEGASPYVVYRNRGTIFQHIDRIVFLAGLNRWERLIQNLRSSRAIEIEREFGSLAESVWLGHSEKTARDHYLHILDEDYERAAKTTVKEITTTVKTTVKRRETEAIIG